VRKKAVSGGNFFCLFFEGGGEKEHPSTLHRRRPPQRASINLTRKNRRHKEKKALRRGDSISAIKGKRVRRKPTTEEEGDSPYGIIATGRGAVSIPLDKMERGRGKEGWD